MVEGICALCKKKEDLKQSHIIPKFVGRWLKETSATGILRGVIKPGERIQDLPKIPLLCEDCELIFSRLETYFANNIFYPFFNDNKESFEYDERLFRFLISLSWRTLKASYQDQIDHSPWIIKYVDTAEEMWRKFLLNEISDPGPYEHHMFFLDYVEKGPNMPNGFQWYTLRATDSTLVNSEEIVFTYTHFPWMFFMSTIFPTHQEGWVGTEIKTKGKISRKFNIEDALFGDFLINRARKILEIEKGSNDDRILRSLEKNPERFLNSDSFVTMIEEAKRERRETLKRLPEGIRALVDVIERSLDHPELDPLQQRWVTFTQHVIANDFTHMPEEKAQEIHRLLDSSIAQADITKPDVICNFKTELIIGRFMVNYCGTKHEQRQLLENSIDELVKERDSADTRFIIVFSFNPLDIDFPFETGYFLE